LPGKKNEDDSSNKIKRVKTMRKHIKHMWKKISPNLSPSSDGTNKARNIYRLIVSTRRVKPEELRRNTYIM